MRACFVRWVTDHRWAMEGDGYEVFHMGAPDERLSLWFHLRLRFWVLLDELVHWKQYRSAAKWRKKNM